MKSAFTMWKYSRMLVLTALGAALYAAGIAILSFPEPISIIPLAQIFPIPLSLMFGPAGAWGLAIGATIGALLTGQFSIGNLFGFFGNFALGFLPYILWRRLKPFSDGTREVAVKNWRHWILYVLVAAGASFSAGVVIAWPMHIVGVAPFSFLVNLIGVQDTLVGILTIILVALVYRRIEALGLLYWEVMDEKDLDGSADKKLGTIGAWLIVIASFLAWLLGGILFTDQAAIIGGVGTGLIVLGIVFCSL